MKTLNPIVFYIILCALFTQTLQAEDYRRAPFYKESREPHRIEFINTGLTALQKRLDLINQAQESIEFEYFIIHNDPSSRLLLQALSQKAREGVRVRVIFDDFFVRTQITPHHAHAMKEAGVEVRYYNPVPLVAARQIHYRNHRKLLSVDDQVAIIGGRNLRDRYFDMHPDFNYIDRDILVEGALVKTMRESFDEYWNFESTLELPRPARPSPNDLTYRRGSRLEAMRRYQDDLLRWNRLTREARDFITENSQDRQLLRRVEAATRDEKNNLPSGECSNLVFASDVPGVGAEAQERRYRLSSEITFEWMNSAQEEVYMESAFVIINDQTSQMLQDLLDRDVELKVMTNSFYSTDLILTTAVFFDRASEWIDRGIRFAAYKGDPMPTHILFEDMVGGSRWGIHSKSKIVDNKSFMVGSLNFDPRSFNWSSELVLICEDRELTAALKESLDRRWDASLELRTPEKLMERRFDRVGLLNRLGYYLVKYPASLLDYHL